MKILKDNSKNFDKKIKEENPNIFPIKIFCSECDSELEITEEDTHIGWMGARFVTCPCCGEESIVDEMEGITLTKDNIEFPIHFSRTTKGMRHVVETNSDEIVKEIRKGIEYFRKNKNDFCWYVSYGDLFLIIFRFPGDENYFIMVTKDFYETHIPFEGKDYDSPDYDSPVLN